MNIYITCMNDPICSKQLTRAECAMILEKMVARIKRWSTRNISYMGRVVLINSVLITMHSYWAHVAILPTKLLKEVESVCRCFLWKGVSDYAGPGLVAWKDICMPKIAEGLGIRNVHDWNTVAVGKYVWNIEAKKDSLFVR